MSMPETVLLDTHVWLWMAGGERIAPTARKLIEAAADEDGLVMSSISIWEVGMLAAMRRSLPMRAGAVSKQYPPKPGNQSNTKLSRWISSGSSR
jgi:PIN domain nuclease of toxin-antitoxin system